MTNNLEPVTGELDVVVVGGGPAGLQAALTLGRMRRRVVLLDSGSYRNGTVHHMHNFLGHDGDAPAQLRAAARTDVARYPTVEVRNGTVRGIASRDSGWEVALDDGARLRTRKVLLATGLRDELPDTPGLEELWGDVVAHCPYCHGYELLDQPVAVLGSGPHVPMLSALLSRIASRVVVLTDGAALDEQTTSQLRKLGVDVREETVTAVERAEAGASVVLASGPREEVGGIFAKPQQSQAAPFVPELGVELLPSGGVRIDEFGRTSVAGIYAAGDMAHLPSLPMPLASVLNAASAGQVAASAANQDLLVEDHAWMMPR
jgi:thioredoxin reductase